VRDTRVVYSTDAGRKCPGCGWPLTDCHCAEKLRQGREAIPRRIAARLRLENRASGKHVTIVDGLPDDRDYLEDLSRQLKKACGTGGAAGQGAIELQGDQRERLRELLQKKGMRVKG
jgi:translation initiation factor 1